jgi:molybdopterin molybdotransferase
MLSVAESWPVILTRAAPLDSVRVPLASALGRSLRSDARADADSPPFDAAAMDGYALRRGDIAAPLRVVGTSQAGAAFTGAVGPGECVRVLTGAPIPAGLEQVIKQEDTAREGDIIRVQLIDGQAYIRRRGENRQRGDVVVPSGTRLGPPELAALAATGISRPEVGRPARCVHLVTGNELVAPEEKPTGAQIRDSNSTLVAALLQRHGATLSGQARVPDDLAAALALTKYQPEHDVLLISGGAGAGDHDLARPLLKELGYTIHFEQVNVRPGKPLVFASRGSRLAFALPGNPVSHWVVFQLFVGPLLQFLETGREPSPVYLTGRLGDGGRLPPPDPRPTYWPCRAAPIGGTYELTPLPLASSGDVAGLVGANALLPLPLPAPGLDNPRLVPFISCP